MFTFTENDPVVIRQDATNSQRYGKVIKVNGRGEALVQLFKDKTFKREGRLLIKPDGKSGLGLFTLIKHMPYQEFLATGGRTRV